MAQVSLLSYTSVHPPYCYYLLFETRKYEVGVACNGITFVLSFVNIDQVVQKLKESKTQRIR